MSVGRKKVPAELAALHGNPRQRKVKPLEPIAGGNLFDAPKWMSADQKEEWRYITDNAVPGLLTTVDRSNLTAYVVSTCLHRKAARELNRAKSLFVKVGEKGALAQHPALAVLNKQALIMLKAAAEMGFTPSSRTRVSPMGEVAPPTGKVAETPRATPARGGIDGFIEGNPDAKPH
jgi:P27 family predicted phage terminase small subunit